MFTSTMDTSLWHFNWLRFWMRPFIIDATQQLSLVYDADGLSWHTVNRSGHPNASTFKKSHHPCRSVWCIEHTRRTFWLITNSIGHTVVGYTFYCTAVRYESIDLKQLQKDCYKRNYVSNCSSCHVDSFAATWYRFAEMEFDAHRLKIRNANRMETSFFGIEESVHCVPVAHFSFIRSIYLFLRLLLLFRSYGFGRNANCTLTSYRLLCAKNCKIKLDCEWNAGWPECRRRNTSEKCQPFNYLIIKHSVRRRLDGEFVRRIHDTCVYGRKAGRQHHHHHQHRTTPHHYRQITTENWEELSDVLLARLTFSRNTPKMAQQNA